MVKNHTDFAKLRPGNYFVPFGKFAREDVTQIGQVHYFHGIFRVYDQRKRVDCNLTLTHLFFVTLEIFHFLVSELACGHGKLRAEIEQGVYCSVFINIVGHDVGVWIDVLINIYLLRNDVLE